MAQTPEGRVKAQVKGLMKAMQQRGLPVYFHMPVQNGMGEPSLDFVGCINGSYFAIETKAPGGKATPRQELTIAEMQKAGAHVMVYDGKDIRYLASWLAMLL